MLKKQIWVAMLLVMVTAVSLACQLPIATQNARPQLPEFVLPEKGNLRASPLPAGQPIHTANWTIDVLEFSRGQAAWGKLKALPYNNDPPGLGEEYVLLHLRLTHTNEKEGEESVGIALTGSAGLEYYSFDSSLTPPSPYLISTLEGGASHEGWFTFVIAEGESDLMFAIDEYATADETLTYAALEEGASLIAPTSLAGIQPTNRGKSPLEPALFGSTVINENWELTLTDVMIGDEAWDVLLDANQFNDPPADSTDYILVKARIRYLGQGTEAVYMSAYHLRLMNAAGELYKNPSLVVPRPRFDFDMYPGAEAEGWLALAVLKDDTAVTLRFNPEYNDDSPEIRYLSLETTGR